MACGQSNCFVGFLPLRHKELPITQTCQNVVYIKVGAVAAAAAAAAKVRV